MERCYLQPTELVFHSINIWTISPIINLRIIVKLALFLILLIYFLSPNWRAAAYSSTSMGRSFSKSTQHSHKPPGYQCYRTSNECSLKIHLMWFLTWNLSHISLSTWKITQIASRWSLNNGVSWWNTICSSTGVFTLDSRSHYWQMFHKFR